MNIAIRAAIVALSIASIGTAYADSSGGTIPMVNSPEGYSRVAGGLGGRMSNPGLDLLAREGARRNSRHGPMGGSNDQGAASQRVPLPGF